MARTAITDNIWEQLQTTMKAHGCHQWKNDRTVMEAILWKLRTGAPWRDIPIELGSWKTAYNWVMGGGGGGGGGLFFLVSGGNGQRRRGLPR
ncbi:transposase, partial [Neisseria meningitidis]|uniref:transposase n=1 Tax=Neisseria meningitidis TaxID=487 RepID=UPI001FD13772